MSTSILSIETRGHIRLIATLRPGANDKIGNFPSRVMSASVIAIPTEKPANGLGSGFAKACREAAFSGKTTCSVCPMKMACYAHFGPDGAFALPSMVKALVRNGSDLWTMPDFVMPALEIRELVAGRMVRLTSIGDPADMPLSVFEALVADGKLAYTHAWKGRPDMKQHCMASVETERSALVAQSKGWRTFRARIAGSPLLQGEIECRSDEGVHCVDCGLCGGLSVNGPNVSIVVHGLAKSRIPVQ